MPSKAHSFFLAVEFACATQVFATETQSNLNAVDAAALETIEAHLGFESVQGLDFSATSKEDCINPGLPKGRHMTHYSVSPETTR